MVNKENGFYKWLHSTKFQVCFIGFGLLLFAMIKFDLAPGLFADAVVKISAAYFGARVLEPIVEMAVKKILKKEDSAND